MNSNSAMPGVARPRTGTITFDRRLEGLTGIAVKGFLLSLVTFGIYRFWYMTNLRRFFWSRTVVDGSPGEYTGTGKELFLGFLVALAVLVPIYILLFAIAFAVPQVAPFSAIISFVVLFVLGQFALYRGRRYRALRTLWRGIRLGQDGSGLAYAGRAALWWIATLLTLGLAFPFMRASLERYRMRHTLIGTSRLASSARGSAILPSWLLIYAVAILPVVAVVLAMLAANDLSFPTDLFVPAPGAGKSMVLNPAYAGTTTAILAYALVAVPAFSIVAALLLFPFYRARETRAFIGATSLGRVTLSSTLRARQFYWPYILYFLCVLGFIAGLAVLGAAIGLAAYFGGGSNAHWGLVVVAPILYIGGALLFAVLYVRVIQARLWAAVATSTVIDDVEGLNAILASAQGPGRGLSEGMADALDVGGALQIGF